MFFETTVEVPQCHTPGQPREPVFHGDFSFNTGKREGAGSMNYIVFSIIFCMLTVIGIYQGWQDRKSLDLNSYIYAGRSLSAFTVSVSIFSTYRSGLSILGHPGEVYRYTTMHIWASVGFLLVGALTATICMPTFYQLGVGTSFEYLEYRFSKGVHYLGAFLYLVQCITYLPFLLYAPGYTIHSVTGFSLRGSILAIGLSSTVYVIIGGTKAVIMTDVFQVLVIFVGMLTVLIQATLTVGGLPTVWESLERSERLEFFDVDLNPRKRETIWNYLISLPISWMGLLGTNQDLIHRSLTCHDLSSAKLACYLAGIWNFFFHTMACFVGMFMSAFYEHCDPKRAGFIHGSSEITIFFVLDIFGDLPWAGLFIAAIICASLSSFSSIINSSAAVVVECFVKRSIKVEISDEKACRMMQFFCIILCIVAFELSYVISTEDKLHQIAFSVINSISTPLMGLFTLGLYYPHINSMGAATGCICSILVSVAIAIAQLGVPDIELSETCVSNCDISALSNSTKEDLLKSYIPQPKIDLDEHNIFETMSVWHVFSLSLVVCYLTAFLVTLITGPRNPKEIDPRLIVPVLDILFPFCYFPESCRKVFRYGIDHSDKWLRSPIRIASLTPPDSDGEGQEEDEHSEGDVGIAIEEVQQTQSSRASSVRSTKPVDLNSETQVLRGSTEL